MFRHLAARLSGLIRGRRPLVHDEGTAPGGGEVTAPSSDEVVTPGRGEVITPSSDAAIIPGGDEAVRPEWAIVANVVDERPYGPDGAETKRGLKIFRPNAKVYVVDGFGGMGWETVTVVGQPRKSPRWVTAHVRAKHLHNFRVKLVYTPAALRRIAAARWPNSTNPAQRFGGFWLGWFDDLGSESYRDSLEEVIRKTLIGEP